VPEHGQEEHATKTLRLLRQTDFPPAEWQANVSVLRSDTE